MPGDRLSTFIQDMAKIDLTKRPLVAVSKSLPPKRRNRAKPVVKRKRKRKASPRPKKGPVKSGIRRKFAKRPYKPRPAPPIPKPAFGPIMATAGNPPATIDGQSHADSLLEIWGNRDYLASIDTAPRPMYPEDTGATPGSQTCFLMAATIRHRPRRNPHASNRPIVIYAIEALLPAKPAKRGLLQRLFGTEERPSQMAVVRFTHADKATLALLDYADGVVANRRRLLDQARRDLGPTGRFSLEPAPR
jgi:hypothetical protein